MRTKTVKINGIEYTLQSIPYRDYLDIVDNNTNEKGILMKSGYGDDLFKYCVIKPKVKLDDFDDDYLGGNTLMNEIETFLATSDKPEETKEKGK